MCIDYTSLNKTCPKDPFPLSQIDQIMDSTSGCDLLCFLDTYSGFHQIPMSRKDEEHTAFITVDDLFCYVPMLYGLKNTLPTFVRAMHKIFGDLIRDLIEVYVDYIIVKIKSRASLLDNLAQFFDRLRTTRTKLNWDKCVFRVTAGKRLGFLVSYRGIEANPKKIKMIEAMWPPACIKDVQKLTSCLATLIQFISRLAERALPFFNLLHKSGPFVWTEEAEEAFQELKRYLTPPPVMVAPEPGEPLLLYVAATAEAVSKVLVAERPKPAGSPGVGVTAGSQLLEASPAPESQGGTNSTTTPQHPEAFLDPGSDEPSGSEPMEVEESDPPGRGRSIQRPVYYISKVLHDAKIRYLEVHKLLYTVLIASRKLHHYFQAHKISMVTSYSLRIVLHNPNATSNIAKWAIELAEFEPHFVALHAIKSQVLIDFVVDWMPPPSIPGEPDGSTLEPPAPAFTGPHWALYFDGSSCKQGASAGALLLTPVGE
jgi:hypothetical protein